MVSRAVVGAVSTPARVPVLVPRCGGALRLLAPAPARVQALAVALTPRVLALERAVVLMMPRALVPGPRAALGSVLPGP